MMRFFLKTRNMTGLIFTIGPLLSILMLGRDLPFFLFFFCSMFLSLVPLHGAMKILPFRIWLLLCGLISFAGMVIFFPQNLPAPSFASAILLGIGSCGLLLLLPPWIAVGRYRSRTLFLGLVWTAILLLQLPLRFLFLHSAAAGLVISFFFMAAGLMVCLQSPPENRLLEKPKHHIHKPAARKISFFIFSITASTGICFSMLPLKATYSAATSSFSAGSLLLGLCLAAAPLLSSLYIEKKGIYNGCILSICLCECAILLMCAAKETTLFLVGMILLFQAAGSIAIFLPVLTFYLYGTAGYMQGFRQHASCLPAGLLCAMPFWHEANLGILTPDEPAITLLFLLILGFFCIFFAWKQRFIILKNEIL